MVVKLNNLMVTRTNEPVSKHYDVDVSSFPFLLCRRKYQPTCDIWCKRVKKKKKKQDNGVNKSFTLLVKPEFCESSQMNCSSRKSAQSMVHTWSCFSSMAPNTFFFFGTQQLDPAGLLLPPEPGRDQENCVVLMLYPTRMFILCT